MVKYILVLFCVCAATTAQFQNVNYQQTRQNSFGSPQQRNTLNDQYQQRSGQLSQVRPNSFQQNSFPQNSYQQNTFQQDYSQQQTARLQSSCGATPERTPVSGSCDRYVECVNGTSEEKLCPDGLRFNPNLSPGAYPCQYPNEVPCLERSALQPAQPTEECPHQFAYLRLGSTSDCSSYRSCVNGVPYDFTCPEGLAFNSETNRCDWPDEVADCDAEAFLGFRCPEVPTSRELGPPAGYRLYGSDVGCQKYFICINGKPRALTCGGATAFDELTSSCIAADEVATCPQDLRDAARRARDEEQQRLAKQLKVDAFPAAQRLRNQFSGRF